MSNCPRCNITLTPLEYHEDVTLETCEECHGQWLGPDELKDIIANREQAGEPAALEALQRRHVRGVALDRVRENLPCPGCGQTMEAFNYGGDSGVILDKCNHCGGIWLDGGELDKIQRVVAASNQDLETDMKRFSGRLREVEIQEDRREQQDSRALGTPPLVTALATGLFDAVTEDRGAFPDDATTPPGRPAPAPPLREPEPGTTAPQGPSGR